MYYKANTANKSIGTLGIIFIILTIFVGCSKKAANKIDAVLDIAEVASDVHDTVHDVRSSVKTDN